MQYCSQKRVLKINFMLNLLTVSIRYVDIYDIYHNNKNNNVSVINVFFGLM